MDFEIIEATLEDVNFWLKWRMEVLENVFPEMTSEQRGILEKENLNYFLKAVPENKHIATFAKFNNKIVGTGDICLSNELPSPDNLNGRCAYLMNIYTIKEFRGKGIASQIVKNLITKALNLKIHKIFLETTNEAKNLYKKLGFTEMKGYLILKNGK